jgi:hypothetical protein
MTTVAEIADGVKRLPKNDLARFRKWFLEYDAAASALGLWHLHRGREPPGRSTPLPSHPPRSLAPPRPARLTGQGKVPSVE